MIHPELKCPEHGYRFVSLENDSAEFYEFKCPLKDCLFGVERNEMTRERSSDAKAGEEAR